MEGTPFGRYELLGLLGRGGMGEVWRAHDTAIDRVVALKLLPVDLADDEVFQRRFRREAKAAAGLNEPHVVPIFDFGEIDGRLYVTMRLIEGDDLQAVLDRGTMDPDRAVSIIEQIASALHAAHRIDLIHRDVKPSNILVAEDDFAYLIDFGIARSVGETRLTSTGSTIGTWAYMAPERFQTGVTNARADIYALTCVLYQCLTGELPFPAVSIEQIAVAHLFQPPPHPSEVADGVPTAMDNVIATGMAKDPAHRYASTKDLAAAARRALTGGAVPPPPPSVVPTTAVWAGPTPLPIAPTVPRSEAPTAPYVPPVQPQPTPAPSSDRHVPRWKRPRFVIPAVTAVLAVAALIIAAVVLTTKPADTRTAESRTGAPPPPPTTPTSAGPIDGTYRVEYGPDTRVDGAPHADDEPGYVPAAEQWDIQSACPPTGCVATAARVSTEGVPQVLPTLVFDEVADRWLAVGVEPRGTCSTRSSEIWGAMSLQLQPNGTLSGDFTYTSPIACAGMRTVSFTRTGPVSTTNLADPAAEPPRVASPAQAFHGRYRWMQTFANGSEPPVQYDYAVQTDCVRTGERCLSYLVSSAAGVGDAMTFANDAWIKTLSHDEPCPTGGTAHALDSAEFPLPQPVKDPIPLLVGHGHHENTGACTIMVDFDARIERTGG